MRHSLKSSIGDLPQHAQSLTLGWTRPACGSAWGLVADGQEIERETAVPPAPKRSLASRIESVDLSGFSMSGFG